MPGIEIAFGFVAGIVVGVILWFPLIFAPIALFGDIHANMPGWAIAGSIWFYFICGLIGAVVGAKRL